MATDLIRTSLYASGTSPVNMLQAVFYNQDCMVYDLEDSVPLADKDAARFLVCNMVRHMRPKDKNVLIRVNGIYSVYFDEDLEASVRARPDALRIPKVETADEVHMICEKVTAIEKAAGIPIGSTKLWCNIESHIGVLNARAIAEADERVEVLALGAEDFTASMHARRTKPGWEIFFARNAVLMKTLGFDGKTVVHPRQIDPVNALFTPTKKEIAHAIRVLEAIEEGARQNKGAVTLDGSMLDVPMELRARNIIALAKAAGIDIGGKDHD